MASLWIRSGCDMKVEPSVETYQVGAHFRALIKAILVAPSRILENFFSFHVSLPRCEKRLTKFFPKKSKMLTEYVWFSLRFSILGQNVTPKGPLDGHAPHPGS